MGGLGQQVELDQVLVEPALEGPARSQRALDLVVTDDAALGRVDEEHAARLQATLLHDPLGRDVEHADLGRHDDEVVVGDPEARRSQPVAVEHGTDDRAVGEGDRRRPVPRLDQRRVVSIERLLGRAHRLVVLPRLGDHHQHCVRQAVTAHVQQLERFVERGRVARTGRADGEDALEITREQLTRQQRLARPHPVAVALHRVDLAIVSHVTEGMGERPRREGVGRKARVHERQRGLDALVHEVGEELRQLRRGEHALVHERARREAREVHAAVVGERAQLVFHALAREVHPPFELHTFESVTGQEELAERGLHPRRRGTDHRVVVGHVAPAEYA